MNLEGFRIQSLYELYVMMNSAILHVPENRHSNCARKHPPVTIDSIMPMYSWLADLTNAPFSLLKAHPGEGSAALPPPLAFFLFSVTQGTSIRNFHWGEDGVIGSKIVP